MTLLKSLEIWTAQGICDLGIVLSIASFLLYVARPYFERVLRRLTLRVAADLWWLAYVTVRDGFLFVSAVIGLWTLNLDLMADIKIGLPFVPLGTVLSCGALLVKVFRDTDGKSRGQRVVVALNGGAALMNAVGYALVMEAPGDEYRIASSTFWRTMSGLRSNANPELAVSTFLVAGSLLAALAAGAIVLSLRAGARADVRS